ncbi:MAG: hypothetical protein ACKVPX_02805 [Myxococcaceae bacterium]
MALNESGGAGVPRFRTDLVLSQRGADLFDVEDPTTGMRFQLYDFEVSLARMLNGARSLDDIVTEGARLGIPVTLGSMKKFLDQLEQYGFLDTTPAAEASSPEGTWSPREVWTPETRELYQSGVRRLRLGRATEAVRYFTAMIAADPNNAEARRMLALSEQQILDGKTGLAGTPGEEPKAAAARAGDPQSRPTFPAMPESVDVSLDLTNPRARAPAQVPVSQPLPSPAPDFFSDEPETTANRQVEPDQTEAQNQDEVAPDEEDAPPKRRGRGWLVGVGLLTLVGAGAGGYFYLESLRNEPLPARVASAVETEAKDDSTAVPEPEPTREPAAAKPAEPVAPEPPSEPLVSPEPAWQSATVVRAFSPLRARVRAPTMGRFTLKAEPGVVKKGQLLGTVGKARVRAPAAGFFVAADPVPKRARRRAVLGQIVHPTDISVALRFESNIPTTAWRCQVEDSENPENHAPCTLTRVRQQRGVTEGAATVLRAEAPWFTDKVKLKAKVSAPAAEAAPAPAPEAEGATTSAP